MNQTEYEKLTPEKKWENATIANNLTVHINTFLLQKIMIN